MFPYTRKSALALFSLSIATAAVACGGAADPAGNPNPNSITESAALGQRGVMRAGEALVHGVRFDLSQAVVRIDGAISTPSALAEGMVVRVRGEVNDDNQTGRAESVEEENEVRGPISALGPTPSTFTVLDQLVLVTEQTMFDDVAGYGDLAVEDIVEVHGTRDTAGVIHATRVEREGVVGMEDGLDEIRGLLGNLTATTFSLGELLVDFTGASIEPVGQTLSEGDLVEVHGELSGAIMMATRIEIEDHAEQGGIDDSPDQRAVRFEANLDAPTDAGLIVLGLPIGVTPTTEIRVNGGLAALVAGDGLRVEAYLDSDGVTLSAVRVERLDEPVRADRQILRGPAANVDATARALEIAGLPVDLSGAELRGRDDAPIGAEAFFAAAALPNAVVKARGELATGTLIADEAELE